MNDFNKRRHEFIGGSDIAGIMGLSRWNTPLSLWALKTRQIADSFEMNEAAQMGIDLEEFVAKKFEERSGKKVRVDNREFVHPDHPYMRAHIDRWIVGGEILECKTCSAYKAGEWDDNGIPDEYYLQVNWYLGIVGHETGYIAVLIGGQKFVWKKIEFDKELFDLQVLRAESFWKDYVLELVPPVAIAGDKDTLVELFPESRPESLIAIREDQQDLEASFNDLAIESLEGKSQRKEINTTIEGAENKIRQLIGDNEGLETGQYKATWKNQGKTSVDTKKMKEDGVYDRYAVRGQTRVLRVTQKKVSKK